MGRMVTAAVVGAALVMASGAKGASHHGHAPAAPVAGTAAPSSASAAIAYARAQLGKPYVWAAAGPDAFDCSGLTMRAEQAAGLDIPRTSQEQSAELRHVRRPARGDLVFFAGGDGTPSAPGHVGLVTGPHRMIEAYAPGVPVRYSSFGLPSSPPGDTDPVGFASPGGR